MRTFEKMFENIIRTSMVVYEIRVRYTVKIWNF